MQANLAAGSADRLRPVYEEFSWPIAQFPSGSPPAPCTFTAPRPDCVEGAAMGPGHGPKSGGGFDCCLPRAPLPCSGKSEVPGQTGAFHAEIYARIDVGTEDLFALPIKPSSARPRQRCGLANRSPTRTI